jgi:Arylsulfotransferase (ASST)/FlgD Ig-like domain
VIGLVIQEIDREKNVVFQWRSWDHFEITDAIGVPLGGRVVNYVHGNSIDVDRDGNLIVSARMMNRVTKISRSTGEILWTLGGKKNQFRFINDPVGFSRQHAARRLPDGNLTLFDNGNFRTPPYSRAVEYVLDEARFTARLVWEYRHVPDVFSQFAGYVQRLPTGNTVIGWGTATPTVTEVTPGGEVVYELSFDPGIFSYRAYRFEWPPVLYALVELNPKILNTAVTTGWVTATIEPVGFDPAEIDVATVKLAGVPAQRDGGALGDLNGDGMQDLTVAFLREALIPFLTPETSQLELTGLLTTGARFHGFASVRVVSTGERASAALSVVSAPGALPVRLALGQAVRVRIYNVRGSLVRTLSVPDGNRPGGDLTWDGRTTDGRLVPHGIYFVRVEGPRPVSAKILIRP